MHQGEIFPTSNVGWTRWFEEIARKGERLPLFLMFLSAWCVWQRNHVMC